MKYSVIYYSKTGNTKKLADSIAGELGIESVNVNKAENVGGDSTVFLGSGLYANKIGREMTDFISRNDFRGVKVALFGTSGEGNGREVGEMERLLKQKGAIVAGRYFCRGKFLLFARGHPNKEEIEGAGKFARKIR